MDRLVTHYRNQPNAVNFGGEVRSIRGCELTATQQFCNGAQSISWTEDSGKFSQ